jgi:hypothetical protein
MGREYCTQTTPSVPIWLSDDCRRRIEGASISKPSGLDFFTLLITEEPESERNDQGLFDVVRAVVNSRFDGRAIAAQQVLPEFPPKIVVVTASSGLISFAKNGAKNSSENPSGEVKKVNFSRLPTFESPPLRFIRSMGPIPF